MQYVYPPRPKNKIHPSQLPFEEDRGCWLWQPKFDGDRCVVGIENGNIYLGNRHGRWHRSNKFPQIRKSLSGLKLPKGTHVLDAELLPGDRLVLFDILQYKEYLLGENQLDRLSLLDDLCGRPNVHCALGMALHITDHLWLSVRGVKDFSSKFEQISTYRSEAQAGSMSEEAEIGKIIEGLLLRRKDSILDNFGASAYDVDWQLRCRCEHKNYRF
jgi:ATP-dependent DNA ligase